MSTGNGRTTTPVRRDGPAAGSPSAVPAVPTSSAAPALPPAAATAAVTRVSVLAPTTRADLALPGDVPVGELLPVLVELTDAAGPGPAPTAAGPHLPVRSADRAGATGWTLALLGRAPADPRSSLDELGVLDGDQLVLRRREDAAPAPLYDDVVDAVAESRPAGFRAWDAGWAHRCGLIGAVVAGATLLGALLAAGRAPGTGGGALTAVTAAVVALAATVLAATAPRFVHRPGPAAVLVALAAGAAAVCGLALVGGPEGAPLTAGAGGAHLLVASALALVAAGTVLLAAPRTDRAALAVGTGLSTAAVLGTVTGAVATVAGAVAAARGAGPVEPAAVAAGAGALALVALSVLPRLAVALARLPLPEVPLPAADGTADGTPDGPGAGPGDPAALDRRTERAHALLTGLAGGTVAVLVVAVAVLGLAPAPGVRGTVGAVLAVLLVVLAALRSRSHANAVPATVLLLGAVVGAGALGVGAVAAAPSGAARLGVGLAATLVGAAVALLGAVGPRRRAGPGVRRAVDLAEGVAIAAVVPLACAVADLFAVVRLL